MEFPGWNMIDIHYVKFQKTNNKFQTIPNIQNIKNRIKKLHSDMFDPFVIEICGLPACRKTGLKFGYCNF